MKVVKCKQAFKIHPIRSHAFYSTTSLYASEPRSASSSSWSPDAPLTPTPPTILPLLSFIVTPPGNMARFDIEHILSSCMIFAGEPEERYCVVVSLVSAVVSFGSHFAYWRLTILPNPPHLIPKVPT